MTDSLHACAGTARGHGSGPPAFEGVTWFAFVAPAATAPSVVSRLNSELNLALRAPDVQEKLAAQGAELDALGFRIVIYGISLLMPATRTMRETLEDIRSGEMKLSGTGVPFDEYKDIVGMRDWSRIEDKYR